MAKGIIQKMVTVTVNRGHTIQIGKRGDEKYPLRMCGPGSRVEVPDIEVERLLKTGFILDPSPKKLPSGAEDIDISVYTQSSSNPAPDLKNAFFNHTNENPGQRA